MNSKKIRKPAEWERQGAVMIAWPDMHTDWRDSLDEIVPVYRSLAAAIAERQPLLVLCSDCGEVQRSIGKADLSNIRFTACPFDDTWTRDYGPFVVFEDGKPVLLDYRFNGWGGKFTSGLDNSVTEVLYEAGYFTSQTAYRNRLDFVLEGGSLETDGKGLVMATTRSILSPGRNAFCGMETVEERLKNDLGAKKIQWLHHGGLTGDGTDGHIDMLARFCNEKTICYVGCDDVRDEHFEDLGRMEEELKSVRAVNGQPFRMLRLPMAGPVFDAKGNRLPASYANFLILNEAVLMPFYGGKADELAEEVLSEAFPGREMLGIDARPLIMQGGSIHCATIQFPEGVL